MQRAIGFTKQTIIASAQAARRSPAFLKALGSILDHEGVYYEVEEFKR